MCRAAQVVEHKRNDIDINFQRNQGWDTFSNILISYILYIRGNIKKVLKDVFLCNFSLSVTNVESLLMLMGRAGLSGGETVMLHVRSSRNARPPPEAELLHSRAEHRHPPDHYFLHVPTRY